MQLHHTTTGNGPPMILIHGLFGNGNNLRGLANELNNQYRVVLPDQRNHGSSPWHDHMDYPAMADDIATLMNTLHIETAIVAGHSMGGKTAMTFALRYPGRTTALIALDIAPVTYKTKRNTRLVTQMQQLKPETINTRNEAGQRLDIGHEATKLFILQNLVRINNQFKWRLNINSIQAAMPTIAAFPGHSRPTQTPAIFIHGQNSDYLQQAHKAKINKLFPNNRIKSIADTAHWLHAEKTRETATAIKQFLEQQQGKPH